MKTKKRSEDQLNREDFYLIEYAIHERISELRDCLVAEKKKGRSEEMKAHIKRIEDLIASNERVSLKIFKITNTKGE